MIRLTAYTTGDDILARWVNPAMIVWMRRCREFDTVMRLFHEHTRVWLHAFGMKPFEMLSLDVVETPEQIVSAIKDRVTINPVSPTS